MCADSQVLAATPENPVSVRSLVPLTREKNEEEALRMVFMLWEEGFVTVIPGKGRPAAGPGCCVADSCSKSSGDKKAPACEAEGAGKAEGKGKRKGGEEQAAAAGGKKQKKK